MQSVCTDSIHPGYVEYSVQIMSQLNFPQSKTNVQTVTLFAKTFYIFSQFCSHFSTSPQFPSQLVQFTDQIPTEYLKQIKFHFDLIMRYALSNPSIRSSFALRHLICTDQEQAYLEISSALSKIQREQKLATQKIKMHQSNTRIQKIFKQIVKKEIKESLISQNEQISEFSQKMNILQSNLQNHQIYINELIKLKEIQIESYDTLINANMYNTFDFEKVLPIFKNQVVFMNGYLIPLLESGKSMITRAMLFVDSYQVSQIDLTNDMEQIEKISTKIPQETQDQLKKELEENCEMYKEEQQSIMKQMLVAFHIIQVFINELKQLSTQLLILEADCGQSSSEAFSHLIE
ncbi:Conserved_hypothetical protein [Hexamita inflata]|uniref:HAUS augmin-like complex subunit 6 N-terminal domain-containing protein n=1 Tax=Hexamita inflata TaxID=28002 RepID=A0ABP1JEY4_9EUKA